MLGKEQSVNNTFPKKEMNRQYLKLKKNSYISISKTEKPRNRSIFILFGNTEVNIRKDFKKFEGGCPWD